MIPKKINFGFLSGARIIFGLNAPAFTAIMGRPEAIACKVKRLNSTAKPGFLVHNIPVLIITSVQIIAWK
jgi:hypothetical protein